MLQFWWDAIGRAIAGTFSAIGRDPSEIRFSVLIIVICLVLVFIQQGHSKAWQHMNKQFVTAMAKQDVRILLILGAAIFVFQLIKAPWSMWSERNASSTAANEKLSKIREDLKGCTSDLKSANANREFLQGQLSSQQSMINTAQNNMNLAQSTMNKCVLSLINTSDLAPQQTTKMVNPVQESPEMGKHFTQMLLLTNRPVSPVRMAVQCSNRIHGISALVLNSVLYSGSGKRPIYQEHSTSFEIDSPSWTPTNPLAITVYYDEDKFNGCNVTPN